MASITKKELEEISKEKSSTEKHRLLKMAEISLWLDTYDDIFSDFDSRPFSERALSDDFLLEIKKGSLDKEDGAIELKFLIPAEQRNLPTELLIKKRLKEHFKKHHNQLASEMKKIRIRGIIMAAAGVAMILTATQVAGFANQSFFTHLIRVILEPGGWFTGWTGLDQFYYTVSEIKPHYDFYQKMEHAEITFWSY